MLNYSEGDLLRIAKRIHNPKRSFLLVDPLQAKHMPVSPTQALEMMRTLGSRLAGQYPGVRLVIGFAETATAIGAVVAQCYGPACVYLPTTREVLPDEAQCVQFLEEHSHAVEQKLCARDLDERIRGTETIVFVDDEISTGRTLINIVRQLRERYPALEGKRLVAASLLDRVSPEDGERMAAAGLERLCLVRLSPAAYTAAVADLAVREAAAAAAAPQRPLVHVPLGCPPLPDPRTGVYIGGYAARCTEMAQAFLVRMGPVLETARTILVLGTEECMYPALVLGQALEAPGGRAVRCHATTRSPIGVSGMPGYPITSGSRLPSFYAPGRTTYVYDQAPYDAVVVVSDTPSPALDALWHLMGAWEPYGYGRFCYVRGGSDVWYV